MTHELEAKTETFLIFIGEWKYTQTNFSFCFLILDNTSFETYDYHSDIRKRMLRFIYQLFISQKIIKKKNENFMIIMHIEREKETRKKRKKYTEKKRFYFQRKAIIFVFVICHLIIEWKKITFVGCIWLFSYLLHGFFLPIVIVSTLFSLLWGKN